MFVMVNIKEVVIVNYMKWILNVVVVIGMIREKRRGSCVLDMVERKWEGLMVFIGSDVGWIFLFYNKFWVNFL